MLTYDMESRGDESLYIYLYNRIKADIMGGVIRPNEKLPSKRNLAEHLKISVMTVQNAYLQLLSEGYITSRCKSGYYAAALDGLAPALPLLFRTENTTVEHTAEYFINFCENSISPGAFPFSVWTRQMREVLSENAGKLLTKLPNAGVPELRRAIADFLYRFRGMGVSPEQIIVGAGTEYLYGLLVKLLGRDKIFAVEDPGYRKIAQIYRSEGVDRIPIALDSLGISVAELAASRADVVHISPSHHFPTGIVMPIKRRQEILGWAGERPDRLVVEDDYDSEFRFTGKAIPTVQSIDAQGRVIYVNTFSKTISPAIRISYMVLPLPLLERYRRELGFYSCTVSSFEQYTLAKFIESGGFERHLSRMRRDYKLKRDRLIRAIRSGPLGGKFEILEENAGLHFLLKLDTDKSDMELVREAAAKGIKLSCLSQYSERPDHAERAMVILNYSGVDPERAEKAVCLLADIL